MSDEFKDQHFQVQPPGDETQNFDDVYEGKSMKKNLTFTNKAIQKYLKKKIKNIIDESYGDPEDGHAEEVETTGHEDNYPSKGEDNASEEAHRLGLTYGGWGKWKDKEGKTVARTIDGNLVKLDKPEEEPKKSPSSDELKNKTHDKWAARQERWAKWKKEHPEYKGTKDAQMKKGKIITDPKVVGHIEPPKKKDGSPWEVEVGGKRGMIDAIDNDKDVAIVTFDDGTSDEFPVKELKPAPKTKVPDEVKNMIKAGVGDARKRHEDKEGKDALIKNLVPMMDDPEFTKNAKEHAQKLVDASGKDPFTVARFLKDVASRSNKASDKVKLAHLYGQVKGLSKHTHPKGQFKKPLIGEQEQDVQSDYLGMNTDGEWMVGDNVPPIKNKHLDTSLPTDTDDINDTQVTT